MAEVAFKQMIATFVRQTRPQTFRHSKPPRYPQRSIATAAVAEAPLEQGIRDGQSEWQAHPLSTAQPSSPQSQRLQRLREESTPRPFSSFLTDNYSREHNYLRISLTERCNLRCLYCMPEEGIQLSPPDHILTTPEIVYLSSLFVNQGVDKIRLTGGEPTVRKDILELMRQIGSLRSNGLKELCLTTNGISLHRKLDSMVESGLTGVNLSLDTLDPFQFTIMTRRNGHDAVLKSVSRILEMNKVGAGIKLKINCVVMRGMNDREIIPFIELGRDKDIEVRFIEYMPFDGNKWSKKKMMGFDEMLAMIRDKYPNVEKVQDHANDTSKTYKVPGFAGRIGFITSMTHNFCGTCNRLRITSDGNLKVCLFGNSEVSLRDILRESNDGRPIDAEAMEAIKQIESDRMQAIHGSTGALGISQREARLLDVIGMAVKRKKEKHADVNQRAHVNHTAYRLHSPLRTESALLAVRSSTAFSKPIPMHLLPHASQSSIFQQQRYRSTFLLKRTYITRKPLVRYIFHVPTHRRIIVEQTPKMSSKECMLDQQRNKGVLLDAVKVISRMSRFSTAGARKGQKTDGRNVPTLTHLTSTGRAHMVDIGHKKESHRSATAICHLQFSQPSTYQALMLASIKKGDALAVARVAGIQAAKKTADLIPLAHPGLGISSVKIDIDTFAPDEQDTGSTNHHTTMGTTFSNGDDSAAFPKADHGGVRVTATVECWAKTGIEMEALTAANVATLTIYDMLKGIDKTMLITGSRVIEKKGGKSGSWKWNAKTHSVQQTNSTTDNSAKRSSEDVRGKLTTNQPLPRQEEIHFEVTSNEHRSTATSADMRTSTTTWPVRFDSSTPQPHRADIDENSAQSILEAEWQELSSSFTPTASTTSASLAPSPDPASSASTPFPSRPKPRFTFSANTWPIYPDEENNNETPHHDNKDDINDDDSTNEVPHRSTPVSRNMISGDAHYRADSAGFQQARIDRYEAWKKNS